MSKPELCGYSNCFRPFYKKRGFMPCCKFHYEHPQKWNKELGGGVSGFTGSVFIRKEPERLVQEKDSGKDVLFAQQKVGVPKRYEER